MKLTSFVLGLLTGCVLWAGLGMLLPMPQPEIRIEAVPAKHEPPKIEQVDKAFVDFVSNGGLDNNSPTLESNTTAIARAILDDPQFRDTLRGLAEVTKALQAKLETVPNTDRPTPKATGEPISVALQLTAPKKVGQLVQVAIDKTGKSQNDNLTIVAYNKDGTVDHELVEDELAYDRNGHIKGFAGEPGKHYKARIISVDTNYNIAVKETAVAVRVGVASGPVTPPTAVSPQSKDEQLIAAWARQVNTGDKELQTVAVAHAFRQTKTLSAAVKASRAILGDDYEAWKPFFVHLDSLFTEAKRVGSMERDSKGNFDETIGLQGVAQVLEGLK